MVGSLSTQHLAGGDSSFKHVENLILECPRESATTKITWPRHVQGNIKSPLKARTKSPDSGLSDTLHTRLDIKKCTPHILHWLLPISSTRKASPKVRCALYCDGKNRGFATAQTHVTSNETLFLELARKFQTNFGLRILIQAKNKKNLCTCKNSNTAYMPIKTKRRKTSQFEGRRCGCKFPDRERCIRFNRNDTTCLPCSKVKHIWNCIRRNGDWSITFTFLLLQVIAVLFGVIWLVGCHRARDYSLGKGQETIGWNKIHKASSISPGWIHFFKRLLIS